MELHSRKQSDIITQLSIINNINKSIKLKNEKTAKYLKILLNIINIKDQYTCKHTKRVVTYAKLISDKLNLNDTDKFKLVCAAYMHDIGKIGIPKQILVKTTPLTNDEWSKIKEHPNIGFEMIKNINIFKNVAPIILHHHERYDGTGYPTGLKGEDIPYLARILTVVDSFDAMTSQRVYNTKKNFEEGKKELIKYSGTQFDPKVITAFIEVINEIK